MTFVSQSRTARGKFRVAAPIEEAFPLFSPRGEEAWVPGWQPEMLHAPESEWEEELVWRTRHSGAEIIWFVAQLDREAHRVRYHRVDGHDMAVTIEVSCEPAGRNETDVRVRYRWVGLNESGNQQATAVTDEAFAQRMEEWAKLIAKR